LPRDWRELLELSGWASQCGSDLPTRIISASDILLVERQAYRFGREERYEFRLLLHFLSYAPEPLHRPIAEDMRDLVRQTCFAKDHEARSILTAYTRLDNELSRDIANQLGIEPEAYKKPSVDDSLEQTRQEFRERDKSGDDYEIRL
jgi:hypothetical protein